MTHLLDVKSVASPLPEKSTLRIILCGIQVNYLSRFFSLHFCLMCVVLQISRKSIYRYKKVMQLAQSSCSNILIIPFPILAILFSC